MALGRPVGERAGTCGFGTLSAAFGLAVCAMLWAGRSGAGGLRLMHRCADAQRRGSAVLNRFPAALYVLDARSGLVWAAFVPLV